MIYTDEEYYRRLLEEQKEENNSYDRLPNIEDLFNIDDDDDDFDREKYKAASQEFGESFMSKAYIVTLDLYPQFRLKRKELKEALLKEGISIYELIDELNTCDGTDMMDVDIDIHNQPQEFYIDEIYRFVRNRSFDYLLENYHEWLKRKTSFEYVYVESFYASVYIKKIHTLLVNLIHKYSPGAAFLPSERLGEIYDELRTDAWSVYCAITGIDPDELNKSSILLNLEDYEFDNLLYFRGPDIIRNKKGKIIQISIARNLPNHAKVPSCCLQCKDFNNDRGLNFLCTVTRFNQPVSEFSCRAWRNMKDEV
jgi:hypothetical protein